MTTCEPQLNGGDAEPHLTLWPEDSPASPSPSQGAISRRPTNGGSGPRWPTPFADYDPATCSWRTFQGSLLPEWGTYSESWPVSGMTRTGIAYQRPTPAPPISVSASGSLPTPSASSYGTNQGGGMGRVGPARPSLETMARHNLWPTPRAIDGRPKGNGPRPDTLTGAVNYDENRQRIGTLNPAWVEWLMGYPIGWTDCGD